MPKYLSGRVRRTPQDQLTNDRYEFLGLEQAEPNVGNPPNGGSSDIPLGDRYQIISILDDPNGGRYWVPLQGGVAPAGVTLFDEGSQVGTASSVTQIDFRGNGIGVTANKYVPGVSAGTIGTITVSPPGNSGEVLFSWDPTGLGVTDFGTSSNLVFDKTVGILTVGQGLDVGIGGTTLTVNVGFGSVGIGTTIPHQDLHLQGNLRLTGTIYDFNNDPGTQSNILTRGTTGVEWTSSNAITAGAGGTIFDIQYHSSSGYVDGASNFVWNSVDKRVGIGSTQPEKLLDVFGSARFSELEVTGLSTFVGVSSFNGTIFAGVSTSYNLHEDRVVWVGIGSTLQDSPNLKFNGTGLNVIGVVTTTDLKVSGVSTVGNIQSYTNTIETTSGNLTIGAEGGTIETSSVVSITENLESTTTDTGSLLVDGGVGIDKNLNVGGGLSITGPTYGEGEVVGVAVTLAAAGGITTTGGDFYIGGDLYVNDDLFLDEGNFQKLIVNPGVSTFLGSVQTGTGATVGFGSTAYFGHNTKAIFNDNLEIFSGDDSIIRHTKTGAGNDLSIESDTIVYIGNVELAQTMASFSSGGAVQLYDNGTWRFKTTGSGIEVNGTVTDTGANHNGNVVFFGSDGNSEGVKWDKSENELLFLDNVKSIFGTTSDGLEIFHENDNSYIRDSGTGSLLINGSAVQINSADDTVQMISAAEGDSVKLFYNNIERLSTSGAGITVSNQLDTTNLSVSGITTISGPLYDKNNSYGAENGYILETRQNDGVQWVSTGDLTVNNANRVSIGSTNISLTSEFEAAGIGTYYMSFVENANPHDGRENEFLYSSTNVVFDALQNRVGIGTTRPHETLEILSANPVIRLNDSDPFGVYSQIDGAGGYLTLTADGGAGSSDSFISFRIDGIADSDEKLRIKSDGEILIPAGGSDRLSMRHTFGGNFVIKNPTAANLSFGTNNEDGELTILNGGNIGIGSTIPTAKFHVTPGGHSGDGAIIFTHNIGEVGADNNCIQAINADGSSLQPLGYRATEHIFATQNSDHLRIASNGQVRIGDGSANDYSVNNDADSVLQLTSATSPKLVLIRNDISIVADDYLGIIDFNSRDGGPVRCARIGAIASGDHGTGYNPTDLVFLTCPADSASDLERLRITAGGNVNIGVNSSSNPFTYLRFGASQFGAADIRPTNEEHHKVGLAFYTDGTDAPAEGPTPSDINPTEKVRIDGSGHLLPGDITDNQTQDIGSGTKRWNKIYARDINITGEIDITGDVEVEDLLVVGLSTFKDKVNILNNHILHFGATGYDTDGELQIYFDQPSDQSTIYSPNKILSLMSGDRVEIEDQIGANIAVFTKDGSSELYYRGSVGAGSSGSKLETSGLGVTVYGTLDSNNLNIIGVSTFYGDSYHGSNVGIGTSIPTDPVLTTNTSILAVGDIKSNTVTANKFIGDGFGLYSYSSSFDSSVVAGIDTIAKAGWNLYEYTLLFRSNSTNWSQSQKLLVMDNDGLTPEVSTQEYGVMSSNDLIVSLGAQVSGDNIIIQATSLGAVSGIISYKLLRTSLS